MLNDEFSKTKFGASTSAFRIQHSQFSIFSGATVMVRANHRGSDLAARTKQFALRVVRLFAALPNSTLAQVLGKQHLRSGTSVGAQYREALHSRSTAEFVSKLQSAQQELEETCYWLELLVESSLISERRLQPLQHEANELLAILIASVKTAQKHRTTSSKEK
jgi:four helix bundle protein